MDVFLQTLRGPVGQMIEKHLFRRPQNLSSQILPIILACAVHSDAVGQKNAQIQACAVGKNAVGRKIAQIQADAVRM